jgi:hypothetical protein
MKSEILTAGRDASACSMRLPIPRADADAVRTHLLEMAEDYTGATHYRIAAGRTASLPERNYPITQAARLPDGC